MMKFEMNQTVVLDVVKNLLQGWKKKRIERALKQVRRNFKKRGSKRLSFRVFKNEKEAVANHDPNRIWEPADSCRATGVDVIRMIGVLDRCLSEMLQVASNPCAYQPADLQTVKHHAEDCIGAGKKALELLEGSEAGPVPDHTTDLATADCPVIAELPPAGETAPVGVAIVGHSITNTKDLLVVLAVHPDVPRDWRSSVMEMAVWLDTTGRHALADYLFKTTPPDLYKGKALEEVLGQLPAVEITREEALAELSRGIVPAGPDDATMMEADEFVGDVAEFIRKLVDRKHVSWNTPIYRFFKWIGQNEPKTEETIRAAFLRHGDKITESLKLESFYNLLTRNPAPASAVSLPDLTREVQAERAERAATASEVERRTVRPAVGI